MKKAVLAAVAMVCLAGLGEVVSWTGRAGDWRWGTAGNWSGGSVPGVGDAVTVSAGAGNTVWVEEGTPQLGALTVSSGCLGVSNWTTRVWADAVTVGSGAAIVSGEGILDEALKATDEEGKEYYAQANRVWIKCTDLTVAAGGKIDANGRGFTSKRKSGGQQGPGKGVARQFGGVHGGGCFHWNFASGANAPQTFGSLTEPELPGSSGGSEGNTDSTVGLSGGGAIRIEADGVVTVNGEVTADGAGYRENFGCEATPGAGGSVWIRCGEFRGSGGKVTAKGGNKAYGAWYAPGVPGGGGRIAISWDPVRQAGATVAGMEISAEQGLVWDSTTSATLKEFHKRNNQYPGTVWMTDEKVFAALEGRGVWGKLTFGECGEITIPGNFTLEGRALGFANEGFKVTVEGNFEVKEGGWLLLGGGDLIRVPGGANGNRLTSGSVPWEFKVNGYAAIREAGRVEAAAAGTEATDEATSIGGKIVVRDAFAMDGGGDLKLWCDPTKGSSVATYCASALIGEGATVNAVEGGYGTGLGPGAKNSCGGSYGGLGGKTLDESAIYGTRQRPYLPGSGGWRQGNNNGTRGGGGTIRFRCAGEFALNGTLDASAVSMAVDNKYWQHTSGDAGGGIMIDCGSFTGAGEMRADGGTYAHVHFGFVGAGGGGRISVCEGETFWDCGTMGFSALKEAGKPAGFTGEATVAGGVVDYLTDGNGNKVAVTDRTRDGSEGTVGWYKVEPFAADVEWTGGAGDGRWDNPANWSGGAAPAAGEKVAISRVGATVYLDSAMPRLADLLLDGMTLVVSNWTTKLQADNFTVGPNAAIISAGPFTNEADIVNGEIDGEAAEWWRDASRVWIECGNLTIDKDAKIDAIGKGFKWWKAPTPGTWANQPGAGPGAGGGRTRGASHGGAVDTMAAYGSAEWPETPGSSGGVVVHMTDVYAAGIGGGVVKIKATGTVRVDGKILADAENSATTHGIGSSGGAGGSIRVECGRFEGSGGTMSANGGMVRTLCNGNLRYGVHGAGGRIAVHYGELGEVEGMTFDASFGRGVDSKKEVVPADQNDRGFNKAEPGTLWFSDGGVFEGLNGKGMAGRLIVPGCEGLTVDGDLEVDRQLWFGMTNFTLEVTGNLAVGGPMGCLGIGAAGLYDLSKMRAGRHCGTNSPCALAVGGDVAVTNYGKVFAVPTCTGRTNTADEATGGRVTVAGDVLVGGNGQIEMMSDPYWGSSVVWEMRNLEVEELGKVTADGLGLWYGFGAEERPTGTYVGGGHGGVGGNYGVPGNRNGGAYGDPARPYLPGTGGGIRHSADYGRTSRGGGVVRIRASGAVTVDGAVTADGTGGSGELGGCAGGGIWLECKTLNGSGTISAKGGRVTNSTYWMGYTAADGTARQYSQAAPGGGGRVAVYCGFLAGTPGMNLACKAVAGPRGEWTGVVSAEAGEFSTTKDPAVYGLYAEPGEGTVRYYEVDASGLVIIVR